MAVQGTAPGGAASRDRFGLGQFRPYRYRGIPGWNPARVLDGGELSRRCPACGAPAGQECVSAVTGKPVRRKNFRHQAR